MKTRPVQPDLACDSKPVALFRFRVNPPCDFIACPRRHVSHQHMPLKQIEWSQKNETGDDLFGPRYADGHTPRNFQNRRFGAVDGVPRAAMEARLHAPKFRLYRHWIQHVAPSVMFPAVLMLMECSTHAQLMSHSSFSCRQCGAHWWDKCKHKR